MGVKHTIEKKARAGLGLEKYLQGKSTTMPVIMRKDCYGLGYKPNGKERKKQVKNRIERRMASLEHREVEGEPMSFLPLRETFHLARIEHDDIQPKQTAICKIFEKLTINAIDDKEVKGEDMKYI